MSRTVQKESLHVSNVFSLAGKVALVTGGGTGIGFMIARALASNGAKVYIIGRRLEVLEKAVATFEEENLQPGSLIAISGDVGSKAGVEELKTKMEQAESSLDILASHF